MRNTRSDGGAEKAALETTTTDVSHWENQFLDKAQSRVSASDSAWMLRDSDGDF